MIVETVFIEGNVVGMADVPQEVDLVRAGGVSAEPPKNDDDLIPEAFSPVPVRQKVNPDGVSPPFEIFLEGAGEMIIPPERRFPFPGDGGLDGHPDRGFRKGSPLRED